MRAKRSPCAAIALSALVILSVSSESAAEEGTVVFDPPAARGSVAPTLAVEKATTADKGFDLLMTWLEPGKRGGRLKFARFTDGAWTPPITIADRVGANAVGNWPTLTVIDTQAVRRTLIARTGNVVARSGNAGRTWTRLPASELPFSSFAGGDEGAYAFWLSSGGGGAAKLLGTRVLAGQTVLDPEVAEGIGTAAAMTWDGPVVAYRDAAGAMGIDGISVIRRENGKWTAPRSLHVREGGQLRTLAGSPRISALRRRVAAAWSTRTADGVRIRVAFSEDAGRTFGAPIDFEPKAAVHPGPVDVQIDENGHALVLWTAESSRRRLSLNLARVTEDGRQSEARVIAEGLPRRPKDLPRLVRAGARVAVAWVEGKPSRVRAMFVRMVDIPVLNAVSSGGGRAPKKVRVSGRRGRVGEGFPTVELTSLAKEAVSPEGLRGRPVLINFWATWCQPCITEMPELVALHRAYEKKGLEVVGVSVDDDEAQDKVRRFVADRKLPFRIWLDPEMELSDALRVRSYPSTFLIDRGGTIVLRRDRAIEADDPEMKEVIQRTLEGS